MKQGIPMIDGQEDEAHHHGGFERTLDHPGLTGQSKEFLHKVPGNRFSRKLRYSIFIGGPT